MAKCELWDSSLGLEAVPSTQKQALTTQNLQLLQSTSVRLSFRKGGEKQFYSSLKQALLGKAWDLQKNNGPQIQGDSVTAQENITIGIGQFSDSTLFGFGLNSF